MSGTNLIDDYLSELMDDPSRGKPGDKPAAETPAAATDADAGATRTTPSEEGEEDTTAREQADSAGDDEVEASAATEPVLVDEAAAPAAEPAVDPLAAFRGGPTTISDDEFEAMLDALQGKAVASAAETAPPSTAGAAETRADANAPAAAHAAATNDDPLAEFRAGPSTINDDEFEAMLDALQGKPVPSAVRTAPGAVASPSAAAVVAEPMPAPQPAAQAIVPEPPVIAPVPVIRAPQPAAAPMESVAAMSARLAEPPPMIQNPPPVDPLDSPTRRRRAEDRVTSWLRFTLARQCFAVEVLKVQEVLRVPAILPVRGTETAMLGVMNLRGQIVPVMDLALRLGFPAVETTEASRVIVLEENGETLGLLVAQVADVVNLSDGRMERISGTPSLVAADVVRGIARREGQIIILLDATRLLA